MRRYVTHRQPMESIAAQVICGIGALVFVGSLLYWALLPAEEKFSQLRTRTGPLPGPFVGAAIIFVGFFVESILRAKKQRESGATGSSTVIMSDGAAQSIKVRCRGCSQLNDESARFCQGCGQPV